MSNRATSIYFLVFAIAYGVYTIVIAKHGFHIINSLGILGGLGLAGYFHLKNRENKK